MTADTKQTTFDKLPFFLTLLLGLLTALAVVYSGMKGTKWLAATSLAAVVFYSFFITTKNLKPLLLWIAVASFSIHLNVHLIMKETPYSQIKGLGVGLFDLAMVGLIIIWILQLAQGRQKFRFFPIISIPFLIYILLAGISVLKAQDKILSLSMLVHIARGYITFLYFANNVRTRNELILILSALTFSIYIQGLVGGLQHLTGGTIGLEIFGETGRAFRQEGTAAGIISRVGGTIGEANGLAMYLNFYLPVLFCFVFTDVAWRYRVICLIAFFTGGVVEILTFSRGGWIALGTGTMVALYGVFKAKFGSRMKSSLLTVIIIMFIAVIAIAAVPSIRDRLFKDDYGAAYSRIPMMQVAFEIIKQHPFSGVGLNNYATVMNRYDRTREGMTYRFPHPVHNAFLMIAAESGLFALLCFMLVLLSALVKAAVFFQLKDRFISLLGIGFACGLLTYMIHAQFRMDFAGRNTMIWFSIGMIMAIHTLLKRQSKDNPPDKITSNTTGRA